MLLLAATLGMSAALAAPTLNGAHVSALVVNARTGAVAFERNSNDAFQPASTLKLLVGSVALQLLGPDSTLQTEALTDGSIQHGTLYGNLYVRGGGDPAIDAAAFEDAARTLAAQHLNRLSGSIVIDNSAFTASPYPDGWTVDDLPNDYAAPITALAFNENAVALRLTPSASNAPALIAMSPQDGTLTIDNRTITGSRTAEDSTQLEWPSNAPGVIRVTGTVPANVNDPLELDAAVPDPVAFAGSQFERALATEKIAIDRVAVREGTTPPSARVLWQHRSPAMRDLIAKMWLPSDDFFAESLLEDLAQAPATADTRAAGIAREMQWLQTLGVAPAAAAIADGSGVSQYDRLSAATLVSVLRADWRSSNREAIVAALPVAGQSGTLERSFKNSALDGIVHAKTGSMMHVRTLAGYVLRPNADPLIFALLVNDWMDSSAGASSAIRLVQERFLEAALQP